MMDPKVVARMKNGTCAVGYITVPRDRFIADIKKPFFKVLGTAFLVRDDLAMTNRHVIQALLDAQADLGFLDDQRILMFVAPSAPGLWQIVVASVWRMGFVTNASIDIGLIAFTLPDPPTFKDFQPLIAQPKLSCQVTEEVAICGYPYGSAMLQKDGKVYRWGPLIQQGHISAISPFENANSLDEILLDVRIAGGMSGAPVIRPSSGEVVAIVHRSWETTTAVAFPLDAPSLASLLAQYDQQAVAA